MPGPNPMQEFQEKILINSDPSQFINQQPSEIEKHILCLNENITTFKRLYKLTDETALETTPHKLDIAIRYAVNSGSFTDKEGDNSKAYGDRELKKYQKSFQNYQKDAEAIDKEGGSNWSRFKNYFVSHKRFVKSHVLDAKQEYLRVMPSYLALAGTEATPHYSADAQLLEVFKSCLSSKNKMLFLRMAVQLNRNLEDIKQIRDQKIVSKMYLADEGHDKEERANRPQQRFMSFGKHRNFVGFDEKTEGKTSYFIQEKDTKKVGSHVSHIQAARELEQRMEAKKVGDVLNADIVLTYLDFNPDEFESQMNIIKRYNSKDMADALIDIRGRQMPWQNTQAIDTSVSMVKDLLSENAPLIIPFGHTGLDAFLMTLLPLFNVEEMGKARDVLEAIQAKAIDNDLKSDAITSGLTEDHIKELKDLKLEKGGDDIKYNASYRLGEDGNSAEISAETVTHDALIRQFALESGLEGVNALLQGVSTTLYILQLCDIAKQINHLQSAGDEEGASMLAATAAQKAVRIFGGGSKTVMAGVKCVCDALTAAGVMSLGSASIVSVVSDALGSTATLLTGAVDTLAGVKKIVSSSKSVHAARDAKKALDGTVYSGADEAKRAQAKRFLGQRKLAAKEDRAAAIADTTSGAVRTLGAALAFVPVPGMSIVSTVIGAGASAASVAAKLIISKVYKGKRVDQAWADVLGYSSAGEYNKLINQMGGKGAERFHDVLRRKTGLATRSHYAGALQITDAIDLYTGAKAFNIINPGGKASDPNQQALEKTLGGLGYTDPMKYDNIRLADMLDKVKAQKDWKSALRKAITDNTYYNLREDVEASAAKDILSGKYDK